MDQANSITDTIGRVESVTSEVCIVKNIPGVALGNVIEFSSGGTGIVLGFDRDKAQVIVANGITDLKKGDLAKVISADLRVPVTERLLGRVIDPLGRTLDGFGDIHSEETRPLEAAARPIYERALINRPLHTGFMVIDTQIPIGLGQRELLLGERKTGNDELAVDVIINQTRNKTGVISVYVALDAESAAVKRNIQRMRDAGALQNTIVIFGRTSESATINYIAPMVGASIAEWFASKGQDVLVVYDNLTRHAKVYRQLSLLLNRPASREAYPGDIFYLHSRLLERAGAFNKEAGGGTITALPVVETQSEEPTDYITTNLMSITDGHVLFKLSLSNKDIQPPIDSGFSVSRLGGRAQDKLMRAMSDKLKQLMIRFAEVERFMSFGAELHGETKDVIDLGRRASHILHQASKDCFSPQQEILLIHFITSKQIMHWNEDQITVVRAALLKFLEHETYAKLLDRAYALDEADKAIPYLDEILQSFVKDKDTPQPERKHQAVSAETETITSLLRDNEEHANG